MVKKEIFEKKLSLLISISIFIFAILFSGCVQKQVGITSTSNLESPPKISNITVGNGSATISFSPFIEKNGASAISYTVTANPGNISVTKATSPIVVTGLENGASYNFTVKALTISGLTSESATSNTVTLNTVPSAPSIINAVASVGKVSIYFNPPTTNGGVRISSYTVTSSPDNLNVVGVSSPILVSGLRGNTNYTFRIKATNAIGSGAYSEVSNNALTPSVPDAPTITSVVANNGEATVFFNQPISNGGAPISSFLITADQGNISKTYLTFGVLGGSESTVVSGLTNGLAYKFTVKAINSVGASLPSNNSESVIPKYVPNAPTITSVIAGDSKATINFMAPIFNGGDPIINYTVVYNPGNISVTGLSSPIVITGLTNGTTYTFSVKATNSMGTGPASTLSNNIIPMTIPDSPIIGTATASNAYATINFTAPASNGGGIINSYTVTSNPGNIKSTGTSSPISVSGLTNGTDYTFTVVANNLAGGSNASAASNSVTPLSVPGPPTIGSVSSGNTQAIINFTPPLSNGGTAITNYTVISSPGGFMASGTSSPITITGLSNGIGYVFAVKATNSFGTGPASLSSNLVVPKTTATPPIIGNAISGNGQATISFTPSVSNGGSAINNYSVISNPGNISTNGTNSPITISGLSNGTSYTFTVVANNSAGSSSPSNSSNAIVPLGYPGSPTINSVIVNSEQAEVNFSNPSTNGGSPILNYIVTSNPGGLIAQGSSSPVTITGLTNGVSYTFTVRAVNAIGTGLSSSPSLSVTPIGVPSSPLMGTPMIGDKQILVNFGYSLSSGGTVITSYKAIATPGNITISNTKTPILFTGLTNGTAYTFKVIASNAYGDSLPSADSITVTPSTIPDPPTIGTVTSGSGFVNVNFTAPISNGGAPVTMYSVTSNPGNVTAKGTSSPIKIMGLLNGITYKFTVTATNLSGTSLPSAESNGVIPVSVPNPPTIGSAISGPSHGVVTFSQPTANGGAAITSYTVTSTPGNIQATGTTSPITINGLTNGVTYTFKVTAQNSVGSSVASGSTNSVRPVSVPDAPGTPTATASNSQATVTFLPSAHDGGEIISSYQVISNPGNIVSYVTNFVNGSNAPISQVIPSLNNGTAYTFKVYAFNSVGVSLASLDSNSVTPATTPSAPMNPYATADNSQATVNFSAPSSNGGAAITSYFVTVSPGGFIVNGFGSPIVINGLNNGSNYNFTVTAVNRVGNSLPSQSTNTVTPMTTSSAPVMGSATPGIGQATISFSPPSNNGGAAITSYTVTSNPGNLTATAKDSPITVTGLQDNTSYTFTVVANNAAGSSGASSPSNSISTLTISSPPIIGTATPGNGQASISFSPPVDNGGSTITSYTVTSTPGNFTASGASSPIIVTGLTNNTSYTFTVVANNSVGPSSSSSASNAVTPLASIINPVMNINAPTVAQCSISQNSQGILTWDINLNDWGICQLYTCSVNSNTDASYVDKNQCNNTLNNTIDLAYKTALIEQSNCLKTYINGISSLSNDSALVNTLESNLVNDPKNFGIQNINLGTNKNSFIAIEAEKEALRYNIFSNSPFDRNNNFANPDACKINFSTDYIDSDFENYLSNKLKYNQGTINYPVGLDRGIAKGAGTADWYFDSFEGLADISFDLYLHTPEVNRGTESSFLSLFNSKIGDANISFGPQLVYDSTTHTHKLKIIFTRWSTSAESSNLSDQKIDMADPNTVQGRAYLNYLKTLSANPSTNVVLDYLKTNRLNEYNNPQISFYDSSRSTKEAIIKPSKNEIQFYLKSNLYIRKTMANGAFDLSLNKICQKVIDGTATANEIDQCYLSVDENSTEGMIISTQPILGDAMVGLYQFDLSMRETDSDGTWYQLNVTLPDSSKINLGEIKFPLSSQLRTGLKLAPLILPTGKSSDEVIKNNGDAGYLHWSLEHVYTIHRTHIPNRVIVNGSVSSDARGRVHFKHGDYLELKPSQFYWNSTTKFWDILFNNLNIPL